MENFPLCLTDLMNKATAVMTFSVIISGATAASERLLAENTNDQNKTCIDRLQQRNRHSNVHIAFSR